MIYSGSCRKADLFDTIIGIITSDGLFSQVSSNTNNDGDSAGSNGFVFKSGLLANNKRLIFGLKDATSKNTNTSTKWWISIAEGYTPSENPNTNGLFANWSGFREWYFTRDAYVTFDTEIKYWVDILPHRIIIVAERGYFGAEYPSVIYLGFADLDTEVNVHLMNNAYIIGTNVKLVANSNVDVLRNVDGTYFTALQLYSFLPPKNPNIAGQYQLSPIYVGSATVGHIGQLDAIWGLPDENINNNDELELNGSKYKVFRVTNYIHNTSFIPTESMIALKVV